MRLEKVDDERPPSKLHEVRSMEASFMKMVENLREFRNFMPQSVLVDSEDEAPALEEAGVLWIELT